MRDHARLTLALAALAVGAGCRGTCPELEWSVRFMPCEGCAYVRAVSWSPDGRQLAAGGDDGRLLIGDAGSGRLVQTAALETGIDDVRFSPDGRSVAALACGTVHVIEPGSGKERLALDAHTGPAALAFSPDGRYLLTAGRDDNQGRVWDAATGTAVVDLVTPGDAIFPPAYGYSQYSTKGSVCVSWSPDGMLAAVATEGTVRLFDMPAGTLRFVYREHTRPLTSVAFTSDGQRLLSASQHEIHVWRVDTGEPLLRLDVRNLEMFMDQDFVPEHLCAAFSPDGRRIVAASNGFKALVLRASDGRHLGTLAMPHGSLDLAYSPSGRSVVMACPGGLFLWSKTRE